MKKLSSKVLTSEFNTLRIKFLEEGKTFSPKNLVTTLKKYGFNRALVYALLNKDCFICSKNGSNRTYSFKNEPLYEGRMAQIIDYYRQKNSSKKIEKSLEEESVDLLKERGYKISRLVGFDEKRFASENPELYQKYLIYEYV